MQKEQNSDDFPAESSIIRDLYIYFNEFLEERSCLTMSLTTADVKKIAHLARLTMSEKDLALYTHQLSDILDFVAEMNQADTSHIDPVANPLDLSQRLRPDVVTEHNQREVFQSIAPEVQAGLYLVPKVIEDE